MTLYKNFEAIANFPMPKDIPENRSFCGFANYYVKFAYNMAKTLTPFNK